MEKKRILRLFAAEILVMSLIGLAACRTAYPETPGMTSAEHTTRSTATRETMPPSQDTVPTVSTGEEDPLPQPTVGSTVPAQEGSTAATVGTLPATRPEPTEPEPIESKPTEPTPTQPKPTEVKPTEAKPTEPKPTEPYIPQGNPQMPGLQYLLSQSNGETLARAYDALVSDVDDGYTRIYLERIASWQVMVLMDCYLADHPEAFWLSGGYSWDDTDEYTRIDLRTNFSGDLPQARADLEAAVQSMLSLLRAGMSDYEKALVLHDALIERCAYASGPNCYNAYGALVEGSAVCQGYAEAYQLLMIRAGIPCMVVSGTGNGGAHAWNAVKMDGSWYYTDVTWDDPVDNDGAVKYYGYFGLTQAMMERDHVTHQGTIPLPQATNPDGSYYARIGHMAESFDRAQVTGWLDDSGVLRIYVTGDVAQYVTQLRSCIFEMMADAGVYTGRYSFTTLGYEVIILF